MKPRSAKAAPRGREGSVRIIGGRWRGTRLPVPDLPGLRPTSDRTRETLFNWLQPALPGARVLDLFAGSGALGLEALSRGAREALLVERDAKLAESLRQTVSRLHAEDEAKIAVADALGHRQNHSIHNDIGQLAQHPIPAVQRVACLFDGAAGPIQRLPIMRAQQRQAQHLRLGEPFGRERGV
ncbi:MAG: RsmD family RNA methyltransferase, partial [Luteimonas sp.]|nr:RsmD family RNA methyltransferase [Luteimonas sp.]